MEVEDWVRVCKTKDGARSYKPLDALREREDAGNGIRGVKWAIGCGLGHGPWAMGEVIGYLRTSSCERVTSIPCLHCLTMCLRPSIFC